jgi:hypothetical protein
MAKRKASEYHHPAISRPEAHRVAARAVADVRCVFRYLHAMPVTEPTKLRVEKALRQCGYERLVRADARGAAMATLDVPGPTSSK